MRLLGPVEVWCGAEQLDLRWPKNRLLLAILALDAGRPVSADALIDRLWDDAPPPNARRTLYSYVARLRRITRTGSEPAIRRVPGGYLLALPREQVDVLRYRDLIRPGPPPARPPGQPTGPEAGAARADRLDRALALWRGEPLSGVGGGTWATRVRESLSQQWTDVLAQWAAAQLELGRPDLVIDALTPAVAEHPLAERLAAELIRGLRAADRTADALRLAGSVRHRLIDEFGIQSGAPLRRLQAELLRSGDRPPGPAPAAGPAPPAATSHEPAVLARTRPVAAPAQLPADVWSFTGRVPELAELDRLLAERRPAGGPPGAVTVAAISGAAGAGKTALAVHWAHRMAASFPDGQLYLDMHGHDPVRPRTAGEALAGLLRTLGVRDEDIPAEPEERAAVYRTLVAARRMLILVDDAASVDELRPLLPGTPDCFVLVTGRDGLAALVALHGARRIELDRLPPDGALGLLATLIGDRVRREPGAAVDLAEQCDRLPLALRLVAELALAQPARSLRELSVDLAGDPARDPTAQGLRLSQLDQGRAELVRSRFAASYHGLPAAAARAFRLLGDYPGPDLGGPAAAALLGRSVDQARELLAVLSAARLIRMPAPDRYALRGLARAYAAELAEGLEGDAGRRPALTQLLDYYMDTAEAAVGTLHPGGPVSATAFGHREPGPGVGTVSGATAWLTAEWTDLVAVCRYTARNGWPRHTVRLATILSRHLDALGDDRDALVIHGEARDAARLTDDWAGQARALDALGGIHRRQGRYPEAIRAYDEALACSRRIGDRAIEAAVTTHLEAARQAEPRSSGPRPAGPTTASRRSDEA